MSHAKLPPPPPLAEGALRLFALGGLGEIGRNMTVFEFAGRLLVRNGLHQGDYLPDPFDRTLTSLHVNRPMSIVAAIRTVATGNPHVSSPLSEAAVRVLAGRLLVDGGPKDASLTLNVDDV